MKPVSQILLSMFLAVFMACAGEGKTAAAQEPAPLDRAHEPYIRVTEEGQKYLVHPSKILSGGPPEDGIPFRSWSGMRSSMISWPGIRC